MLLDACAQSMEPSLLTICGAWTSDLTYLTVGEVGFLHGVMVLGETGVALVSHDVDQKSPRRANVIENHSAHSRDLLNFILMVQEATDHRLDYENPGMQMVALLGSW